MNTYNSIADEHESLMEGLTLRYDEEEIRSIEFDRDVKIEGKDEYEEQRNFELNKERKFAEDIIKFSYNTKDLDVDVFDKSFAEGREYDTYGANEKLVGLISSKMW